MGEVDEALLLPCEPVETVMNRSGAGQRESDGREDGEAIGW